MAIKTIAVIRDDLTALLEGAAEVTPADFLRWLQDTLDSSGPVVSGGIISHRDLLAADPAAITTHATPGTPVHINSAAWTANMESVGITPSFSNGQITIAAGGDGSYRLDWHISFKGTNGVRYGVVPRVTRGAVNTFETDCRDEVTWATGQVVSMSAFGGVIDLEEGDFVRLYVVASAASATFIIRQAQFALTRVRS